jgi:acetyltransferase-like isoleucine patch superfamily enzyme
VKDKLKAWLEKWLRGFIPYQIAVGGYRYYRTGRENIYPPESFLHYGKNVRIELGVAITAPERLHLGDNVGLSQRVQINAVGGCHIGRACQIAAETIILTVDHQYTEGEALPYDRVRFVKPVIVEDYVWVGARVLIAPGVRIGEGAIIGMGSVVLQDIPPLALVAGNPAQVLTYRPKAEFDRAKAAGEDIDPYKEVPLLKVPPITKRKFKNELGRLGFDVSNGQDYFQYDKCQELSQRLVPVKGPSATSGDHPVAPVKPVT